nr:reverse transcriptase domain-containing protein [Tanacetum cinerariifolium]
MSTRLSARNLFPPLDNPELTIRRRSRCDPPIPDLRTMEELRQPTLNGRGGTFMKRRPEECYNLIENMTAHHNDWDTSAQRSESSSSITSSFDPKIIALKAEMAKINKSLMKFLQPPLAKPRTYMLREPIKVVILTNLKGNNQGRNQFFQGASNGPNPPPAYQASGYQTLVHQPLIPQPSSSGSGTLPSYIITNPKEDLKGITTRSGKAYQGPTIPTTSSSVPQVVEHETEEDLKGITTRSGKAYQGPTIPTTSSSFPQVVEHETEVTKDTESSISPDFVVVDFDADLRVPLILGRSFLKTGRALIDVYAGELTLRVNNESVTFNLDQTSRYSANYNDMTVNRIDVIDMACEEYSQEVLGFSDVIASGNPTLYYDPIVSTSSTTLTPFGDSDFLLEEILMEDDFEPAVQHQRRVNLKIHEVIKKEVLKLLDARLIYPISNSPWVSPVHCVPKKGGFTVVENEENELILTRLVTGWRVCIDYPNKMPDQDCSTGFSSCKNFEITIRDKKRAQNLAADHLSRLENPHQNVLDKKEINETFPLKTLNVVSFCGDSSTSWFADFANYHAENFVVKGMSSQQKNKFLKDVKHYFWNDPFLLKICLGHRFHGAIPVFTREQVYTGGRRLLVEMGRSENTPHQRRLSCLQILKISLF